MCFVSIWISGRLLWLSWKRELEIDEVEWMESGLQNQKKAVIEHGQKGFLVTCVGGKERASIQEISNVLEEVLLGVVSLLLFSLEQYDLLVW